MGAYIGPYGKSIEGVGILEIIKMVTFAWVFYGIMGGFVVLTVGGVVAGKIIECKYDQKSGKAKLVYIWGVFIGFIGVSILSTLDYIIGPW
jgi:hypothetical protein